jgi:hypothetical protein
VLLSYCTDQNERRVLKGKLHRCQNQLQLRHRGSRELTVMSETCFMGIPIRVGASDIPMMGNEPTDRCEERVQFEVLPSMQLVVSKRGREVARCK